MKTLLELRDVTFSYGTEGIFQQAGFTVKPGERIAVIGRNGSGKTTLLRLAAGLLTTRQGRVLLDGYAVNEMSRRSIAQVIAFVPQQLFVPFDFTVDQLVSQGRTPYLRALRNLSTADYAAINEAMSRTQITHLRHRIFNQLSGGEQQRVKIAIALAQQPRLLLLDEPTQHLDIGRQAEILELLLKLNLEGVTIVAAIHDLYAVQQTFPAVALLHDRTIAQGTASELLRPELLAPAFGLNGRALPILRRADHFATEEAHIEPVR
ncbi:MAG TPA: ABC transporter ATP-binding protein [Terriglobales bacterium]|jgi:iron complex transport system ATP-binding protein|nr:ABC transporter ATP-binding protein [Terriglobales bacterium]